MLHPLEQLVLPDVTVLVAIERHHPGHDFIDMRDRRPRTGLRRSARREREQQEEGESAASHVLCSFESR
jgi:hypothetical protein